MQSRGDMQFGGRAAPMSAPVSTEFGDPRYVGLDAWEDTAILAALLDGQRRGLDAVAPAIPHIAKAAELAASALRSGGRLVYLGAGSPGLLALTDALEIPQTYGIARDRIVILMAGGIAMTEELLGGPEDDAQAGAADIAAAGIGPNDFVVCLSASGTTRYTVAGLRVNTRLEIARLHRELSATMVYVTHDQVEAMTLADKIVVMNVGRIEQIGTPMELYNRPANLFVAGFIGSPQMNVLDAAALGEKSAKTIGIRPEHISVSETSGELSCEVVHIEQLGADTNLYLSNDKIGLLTARLFGEHYFAPGATVFVTFDKPKQHLFDAEGKAIR